MIKYLVLAVLTAISTYAFKDIAGALGYSAYKETLGALQNISSIIFAIIGAWIAIIYPRAIGRVFKGSSVSDISIKEADSNANYLSELVEIVMVSAVVLMVVLSIQFSAPIVREIATDSLSIYAKYVVFYVVSMLTVSQLYAIFRVILANYFFLNQLRKKNVDGKVDTLHK
jgi:hypothetical protein